MKTQSHQTIESEANLTTVFAHQYKSTRTKDEISLKMDIRSWMLARKYEYRSQGFRYQIRTCKISPNTSFLNITWTCNLPVEIHEENNKIVFRTHEVAKKIHERALKKFEQLMPENLEEEQNFTNTLVVTMHGPNHQRKIRPENIQGLSKNVKETLNAFINDGMPIADAILSASAIEGEPVPYTKN
jgi:hypothetical protein